VEAQKTQWLRLLLNLELPCGRAGKNSLGCGQGILTGARKCPWLLGFKGALLFW
jgi:hypothetical protein